MASGRTGARASGQVRQARARARPIRPERRDVADPVAFQDARQLYKPYANRTRRDGNQSGEQLGVGPAVQQSDGAAASCLVISSFAKLPNNKYINQTTPLTHCSLFWGRCTTRAGLMIAVLIPLLPWEGPKLLLQQGFPQTSQSSDTVAELHTGDR